MTSLLVPIVYEPPGPDSHDVAVNALLKIALGDHFEPGIRIQAANSILGAQPVPGARLPCLANKQS